jgi:hypothetical protein
MYLIFIVIFVPLSLIKQPLPLLLPLPLSGCKSNHYPFAKRVEGLDRGVNGKVVIPPWGATLFDYFVGVYSLPPRGLAVGITTVVIIMIEELLLNERDTTRTCNFLLPK